MEQLISLAFHATATPEPSIGYSLIHAYCIHGDVKMMKNIFSFSPSLIDSLIALTVPVKKFSSKYDGMTPEQILEVRETQGQETILEFIKENVTRKAFEHKSLIHLAAKAGTCHQIKRLVLHGANINSEQVCLDDYLNENYFNYRLFCTPLHFAAAYNTVEVVKEIVHQGATVLTLARDENNDGYSAAHFAAKAGNTSVLHYVLEKEESLRDMVSRGFTPLHLAVSEGHLETVKSLIDCGADINKPSYGYLPVGVECYGTTPCMIAAFQGRLKILDFLYKKGGDVRAVDELGRSLLFFAVRKSQTEVFKKLLELGLNPAATDNNQQTLLHEVEDPAIADMLLSYGVDVDSRNNAYQTPLHLAAAECNVKLMKLLLSHGADANAQDSNACTPVALAGNFIFDNSKLKNLIMEIFQVLIEGGADVNITDSERRTPLMKALREFRVGYCYKTEALLQLDSNLAAVDREGKSCIHYVSNLERLQMLIERGVPYKAVDNGGNTVLHLIAAICDVQMMSFLLEYDKKNSVSANINDKGGQTERLLVNVANSKGQTALHIASMRCWDKKIVELLLHYSSEVNVQDANGKTALHYATEKCYCDNVVVLLNNGGEPRIAEYSQGNTALHSAVCAPSNSNVKFLVETVLGHDAKRRVDSNEKERTPLPKVLNNKQQSALHLAAKKGQVDVIQLLLDAGCDMQAKDKSGKTPVMYSAKHPNALRLFKERGGEIKPPNKQRK